MARDMSLYVTPAMLSAGIEAACLFSPMEDDFDVMLPAIYHAMRAVEPIELGLLSPSVEAVL